MTQISKCANKKSILQHKDYVIIVTISSSNKYLSCLYLHNFPHPQALANAWAGREKREYVNCGTHVQTLPTHTRSCVSQYCDSENAIDIRGKGSIYSFTNLLYHH